MVIRRTNPLVAPLLLLFASGSLAGPLGACSGTPEKAAAPEPPKPAPKPRKPEQPADLVILGGDIHTVDPDRPRASALAVRGTRIVAVGDKDDVQGFIGDKTELIELKGASVTPGLTDAHCHLYSLGAQLAGGIDLRGLRSAKDVADKVAAAAADKPAGEWLLGRGWDQNLWSEKEFPTAAIMDKAVKKHLVAVRRVDGHAVWVNKAVMKKAGITKKTKDPPGGKIVRDRRGQPTGVFIDAAMALIDQHIPAPAQEIVEQRILYAAEQALAAGITTVHEMGISDEVADVYRRLAQEERLPLRVYAFLSGNLETALSLADRRPDIDETGEAMFVMRAIKLFADGALGSRGAALLAPYSDDPGNSGLWQESAEDLKRAAEAIAAAGWQVGVHAIGDAANRAVLDAFTAASAKHKGENLRMRVEHAQVIAPEDLARFATLEVIASMQPTHATSDMPWAEARLGPERIRGAYAWRALLDSGARIAGGSDFPVEKVSPLLGIHAAVNRTDESGEPKGGWYPEQSMELEEAIDAFTFEGAYAAFAEGQRGRIKPGFIADITIYDRKLQGDTLLKTGIARTIVGGKTRYQAR